MGELTKSKLIKYAKGKTFIETGTWVGRSIYIALDSNMFNKIYSVELHEEFADKAIECFKQFENDAINSDSDSDDNNKLNLPFVERFRATKLDDIISTNGNISEFKNFVSGMK
jgi:tRNA A58 N-methylase Trm61